MHITFSHLRGIFLFDFFCGGNSNSYGFGDGFCSYDNKNYGDGSAYIYSICYGYNYGDGYGNGKGDGDGNGYGDGYGDGGTKEKKLIFEEL